MKFYSQRSEVFDGVIIGSHPKFLIYITNNGVSYNTIVMDGLTFDGVDEV